MSIRWTVILLSVVLVLPACRRTKNNAAPADTTQTIAPAASQTAPNDPVTDTVNVDDGRSEEEGPAGGFDTAASGQNATPKAPAKTAKTAKKHK